MLLLQFSFYFCVDSLLRSFGKTLYCYAMFSPLLFFDVTLIIKLRKNGKLPKFYYLTEDSENLKPNADTVNDQQFNEKETRIAWLLKQNNINSQVQNWPQHL